MDVQQEAEPEEEQTFLEKMEVAFKAFMVYKTPRMVKIYDWRIYLLHVLLLFFIAIVVFYSDLYLNHGYQSSAPLIGVAIPKVKGVARAQGMKKVMDTWDVVYPAKEKGAIFITTNLEKTEKQKQGLCPGSDETELESLTSQPPCKAGMATRFGYLTGMATAETNDKGTKYCEIEGWCPTPNPKPDRKANVLNEVADWVLNVRADIKIPQFGLGTSTGVATRGVVPGLNTFTVRQILNETGATFDQVKEDGCLIMASFNFDCNLDYDIEKCVPEVTFHRIDDGDDGNTSPGFFFRYGRYFFDSGQELRDLYKVYGIRIVFDVGGYGRRSNMASLFQRLGAAAGMVIVAGIVVDKLFESVLPMFKKYQGFEDAKYEYVREYELSKKKESESRGINYG